MRLNVLLHRQYLQEVAKEHIRTFSDAYYNVAEISVGPCSDWLLIRAIEQLHYTSIFLDIPKRVLTVRITATRCLHTIYQRAIARFQLRAQRLKTARWGRMDLGLS